MTAQDTINLNVTEGELNDDSVEESFVKFLNIIQPEHPYNSNPYPLKRDNVEYSYVKVTGPYYARCGPMNGRKNSGLYATFSYSLDKFNRMSLERLMAVLVHEVTHITVGSHSQKESGSHPPRFWREFGFNAHLILDSWNEIEEFLSADLSKNDFIGFIVKEEVNPFNIDKRYGSVSVRREEMARWFKETLKNSK